MSKPSHYFIASPQLLTHERELPLHIFERDFRFLSNNGLFAASGVDTASILLLNTLGAQFNSVQLSPPSPTLLDLGCGYGVLGIVLGRVFGFSVTFSDINRIALDYAEKNAVLNGLPPAAAFIHSDGFAAIPQSFHHITLNPPIQAGKDVLLRLFREAALHLLPGGTFTIVTLKKHGAETQLRALQGLFPQVQVLYKRKGHYVLQARV